MGGVFCNCFEYPRRTFCVEYHHSTEIDRSLNHYTSNPIPNQAY